MSAFAGKLVEVHAEDMADYIFHRAVTDVKNLLLKDSKNVFVVGRTGSGKTTQCKKLAAAFDMKHISTGELIEKEIKVSCKGFDDWNQREVIDKEITYEYIILNSGCTHLYLY